MSSLKMVALCVMLEFGALCGIPVPPEEIERALKMNQNAVTMVVEAPSPDLDLPED